jgi:GTPase SAR1 family protein
MQDITLLKIIVVGDIGVGKTSLLSQYVHGNFEEKHKPTVGCDFSTKTKTIN